MTDPNLVDFYGRVARISTDHAKGHGFEAVGTLGRSSYRRRRSVGLGRFLFPLITVVLCGVVLKGAIHYSIGGEVYQARVDTLLASDGIDRLGGYLMMADPATVWVSGQLQSALAGGF